MVIGTVFQIKSQESHGIRINCINPEAVDTPLFNNIKDYTFLTEAEYQEVLKIYIPLR